MGQTLHILTKPDDLGLEIITRQRARTGTQVKVVDLTQGKPDYSALLQDIFQSDSIVVW